MRVLLGVAAAVMRRPRLLPTAAVVAWRLVPEGWWRRWPFLPVPDRAYLRFRLETAYGGDGSRPPLARDVVTYLEWCRRFPDG